MQGNAFDEFERRQRQLEEQQRQIEEANRRVREQVQREEQTRRARMQNQQCLHCGRPLGFFLRLMEIKTHFGCTALVH